VQSRYLLRAAQAILLAIDSCEKICVQSSSLGSAMENKIQRMTSIDVQCEQEQQMAKRSKQRIPEERGPLLPQLQSAACVPGAVRASRSRPLPGIVWVSSRLRTIPLGHGARLSRSWRKLGRR
jgi:hypothetical protein